jgi:NTE family protein
VIGREREDQAGSGRAAPKPGIALCFSGGGYRAMLFHVGALLRINEAGLVRRLALVSSVSGGSITAGVLGSRWDELDYAADGVAGNFGEIVVDPLRDFAARTIDWQAVLRAPFMRGSAGNRIAAAYSRHLFGDRTLQDLPDTPRFVINSTSLQTGALWRFEKPYMADYRVGMIRHPRVSLAMAVAASSAFPPVLSPLRLKLDEAEVEPVEGADLHRRPYTQKAVLSDGGVYDNLGLQVAFDSFTTVLISDGGGYLSPDKRPWTNWALQMLRVTNVIDNQVRSLRKQEAIEDFEGPTWSGTYWGIRSKIANYELTDAIPCDPKQTLELADLPTRLGRLDATRQERLINWGYAVCDAALRKHYDPALRRPDGFPYPDSGV